MKINLLLTLVSILVSGLPKSSLLFQISGPIQTIPTSNIRFEMECNSVKMGKCLGQKATHRQDANENFRITFKGARISDCRGYLSDLLGDKPNLAAVYSTGNLNEVVLFNGAFKAAGSTIEIKETKNYILLKSGEFQVLFKGCDVQSGAPNF